MSLNYGNARVLENIDLTIPAGTFLGITGPTGSGKTLLAQLITRSIDPTSGVVKMDGQDVRVIPLNTLRDAIGIVPQEPFLFSDTIANNIGFGLGNHDLPRVPTGDQRGGAPPTPDIPQKPDPARVRNAARLAGLDGDMRAFRTAMTPCWANAA